MSSLIAISLLGVAAVPGIAFAASPIGVGLPDAAASSFVQAAEKKIIVKEPEKHKEVVVKEKKEVVVRPWVKKPHYGQVVAGVALGTIVVASGAGVVPVAPAPHLCWYWTNPVKDKGYWDYC
jgi:hypothetical protein